MAPQLGLLLLGVLHCKTNQQAMHHAHFAPLHIFGDPNPDSSHHIRLPAAVCCLSQVNCRSLWSLVVFKTPPSPLLAKVTLKSDMGWVCRRYTLLLFSQRGEAAEHAAPAHRLVYTYQHTINWTGSLIQVLLHLLVQKFLLHLYLNTVFMFNTACNYYSSWFTLSKTKFIPRVIWH